MRKVDIDTHVVSFIFKNHSIGPLYNPDLAGRVRHDFVHDTKRLEGVKKIPIPRAPKLNSPIAIWDPGAGHWDVS